MPGMSGATAAGNPALTLVLALFMLGYILWTIDRLASLSRARAAAQPPARPRRRPGPGPGNRASRRERPGRARSPQDRSRRAPGQAALGPRLAACYKIAMGIAMGYMLVTML